MVNTKKLIQILESKIHEYEITKDRCLCEDLDLPDTPTVRFINKLWGLKQAKIRLETLKSISDAIETEKKEIEVALND